MFGTYCKFDHTNTLSTTDDEDIKKLKLTMKDPKLLIENKIKII